MLHSTNHFYCTPTANRHHVKCWLWRYIYSAGALISWFSCSGSIVQSCNVLVLYNPLRSSNNEYSQIITAQIFLHPPPQKKYYRWGNDYRRILEKRNAIKTYHDLKQNQFCDQNNDTHGLDVRSESHPNFPPSDDVTFFDLTHYHPNFSVGRLEFCRIGGVKRIVLCLAYFVYNSVKKRQYSTKWLPTSEEVRMVGRWHDRLSDGNCGSISDVGRFQLVENMAFSSI